MTSISLYGAYEQPDTDHPTPKFGHPKDRRPDLKQIQAGLAVTGDGGIPVFHRAYDGGAAKVSQVVGAMTALQKMARPRDFLLIGDSKLVSYTNVSAMIASGTGFIAPAAKAYTPAATLAALELEAATEVDYVAERDARKPATERGRWRVTEDTMTLAGKRKRDPVLTLRRVFVHSTTRAQATATARAKKLDRARDDLDRLARGLGSRHYPDEKAVTARISAIASARRVGAYLRTETVWRAWVAVRRNDGAPGIDGTTLADVEEYGIERLLDEVAEDLRNGGWLPLPARRVLIPKPVTNERRPLSIPAVADRVVQAAVKIVLESIFEADFLLCSFGFRPKRSAHDALQVLIDEAWKGKRWVVETDIADCFSAIPHGKLMQAVEERVSDQGILKLLRVMLRVGVMEDGVVRRETSGSDLYGGRGLPLIRALAPEASVTSTPTGTIVRMEWPWPPANVSVQPPQ